MTCRTCGTRLTPGALLCGECGTSVIAPPPTLGDTAHHDRRALLAAITGERPTTARPSTVPPRGTRIRTGTRTGARTPPSRRPAHAAVPVALERPFSLVFSTGENIRVAGSGLIGRNPVPADGEHVDYLVQLVDPGRSVSKTHLEFALDGGELWVRDRRSTNGTRVGDHPLDSVELPPEEWTRLVRGDRVLLGGQWFDLH